MAQVRTQHPNALLTPLGRRAMVDLVIVEGWGVAATAPRYQVDPKTVRKWRDRYLAEGLDGLADRSSRPRRSPGRTPAGVRAEVIGLRGCRRRGAAWIAHAVGVAPSTAQKILNDAGLGRLDRGDRATKQAPVRYQRERPGELVHVDIKKLPAIPPAAAGVSTGAARRPHRAPKPATATCTPPSMTAPAWRTANTSTTNKAPRPQSSGRAPTPGSANSASPASGSSPTTAAATAAAPGTKPVNRPEPRSRKPAPTGPKPTAKSNASTASSSRNGPTSGPGPANSNAKTPTKDSSTTTITTEPTARSAGTHQPPPSRTTSPACTARESVSEPGTPHEVGAMGQPSDPRRRLVLVLVDERQRHQHALRAPTSIPIGDHERADIQGRQPEEVEAVLGAPLGHLSEF